MMQENKQPLNSYNMPMMGQPQPVATVVYTSRPPDYLIQSILTCILCFCPTGLLAIFYSCRSKDAADQNDFPTAQREGQLAKIFAAISLAIGLVSILAAVIYVIVVFVVFANIANSLMSD